MSKQDPSPVDKAVELLVHVPLGMAAFARDTVPTFMHMFAARGRKELAQHHKTVGTQVGQYRTMGEMAVKFGTPMVRDEVAKRLDDARRRGIRTFEGFPVPRVPAGWIGAGADESAAPAPTNGTAVRSEATARPAPTVAVAPAPAAPTVDAPPVTSLAIPDYDELAASQVVGHLEGLGRAELDAVDAYERAHRARRTILGKIEQLRA